MLLELLGCLWLAKGNSWALLCVARGGNMGKKFITNLIKINSKVQTGKQAMSKHEDERVFYS